MTPITRHWRRTLFAGAVGLTALTSLGGCASAPEWTRRAGVLNVGDLDGTAVTTSTWPRQDWWSRYGDATLSALIDEALAQSPNIGYAQARLAKARALAGVAGAERWPELSAGYNGTRQRLSENDLYPPPLGGSTITQGRLALDFSYELDFWGKHRAALEASLSRERASEAELHAARLVLSGAVAKVYFQLQHSLALREILTNTLHQREQILDLTGQRVAAGIDTRMELRQAEAAVPSARQETAAIDADVERQRHQLAALLGKGPERAASLTPASSSFAPPALPAHLPLDLVGRRADLVAARWRVEAAVGDVAVARKQFYPNVDLLAFTGFSSIRSSLLLDAGSKTAGVGPAIRLPIFEGGALRANLAGRQADVDTAVEQYNGALIEALREVADATSSIKALTLQQREQDSAQTATEDAYTLALLRYQAGLTNYLSVLTVENAVLNQRRSRVDLALRQREADVDLVRALGGGYRSDSLALARSGKSRSFKESGHE